MLSEASDCGRPLRRARALAASARKAAEKPNIPGKMRKRVIRMEMIQIVGIGFIVAILTLVLKEQKPLFAFLLITVTGIYIFLFLLGKISAVIGVLEQLSSLTNINVMFLKTILKIIGIAYIAEFGAQIVRDSGLESIASKIELAGKVLIMVMAIPIITVIIETVVKLLPA